VFALCDCNSFYASCERLFRPDLAHRPVVVLSNNDGCIIALTPEAKALGIVMGTPYFKARELIQRHRVAVFSSNYALYADLSHRVKSVLDTLFPVQEIYSIDESFGLGFQASWDLHETGREIKTKVERYTGIPVAVGFGHSRTQAKLANRWAKKLPHRQGVFSWNDTSEETLYHLLCQTPAQDIWGIGPRIAQRLAGFGIQTAWAFMQADVQWIQKEFTITLAKTHAELWGESQLHSEDIEAQTPQQILSSRSFGQGVEDLTSLREALSLYVQRASEKLRRHHLTAKRLSVFIRTSPFAMERSFYGPHISCELERPSADTRRLMHAALDLLERIYRSGYVYQKAGVMLGELSPAQAQQGDLFDENAATPVALMRTLDAVNQRFGKGHLALASGLATRAWAMKRSLTSPAYTTRWHSLKSIG